MFETITRLFTGIPVSVTLVRSHGRFPVLSVGRLQRLYPVGYFVGLSLQSCCKTHECNKNYAVSVTVVRSHGGIDIFLRSQCGSTQKTVSHALLDWALSPLAAKHTSAIRTTHENCRWRVPVPLLVFVLGAVYASLGNSITKLFQTSLSSAKGAHFSSIELSRKASMKLAKSVGKHRARF